jgi:hypothetical protein
MPPHKLVYVDEVQKDLEKYTQRFSDGRKLTVVPMKPRLGVRTDEIIKERPQLVLIDYQLVRTVDYLGGTLATRIREKLPAIPIVLITRRSLFARYRGAPGEMGSVDYVIYKDDVDHDNLKSIRELSGLVMGFKKLRAVNLNEWDPLVRLLGANESEAEILRETQPVSSALGKKDGMWQRSVSDIARWVIGTLFAYPGVLYDDLHASTALGISLHSFLSSKTAKVVGEATYKGLFHELGQWWWRDRLLQTGRILIEKAGLEPPLSDSFAPAFAKVVGSRLTPSKCIYSGERFADTVCYILKKPVKRKYTLEYFPDNRPQIMESARVSFKAIREDLRVQDELFSSDGRRLLKSIRKGKGLGDV